MKIFITDVHTDIRQGLYCDDIDRVSDTFPDRGETTVRFIVVIDRCVRCIGISIRRVILNGCERHAANVQCRGVSGQDLERRTGLTFGIGSTV